MCGFTDKELLKQYGVPNPQGGTFGMVFAPRETRKTTNVVIGGALDFLIDHPNAAVLIDSHKHAMSMERLDLIKWNIEHNEKFKRYFGDWRAGAREWNSESIRIGARKDGEKEPSIDTSGEDQSKTGAHYDLIIADDLVNDKNSESPLLRERVYRHIQTLYPMLKKDGVLIIVGTFWHYDDAYNRLIADDEKERDRAEKLGQEPSITYKKYIEGAIKPDGKLYAPTILSYDRLDWLRRNLAPRIFAPNYLLVPIEDSDKTFKREYLTWIECRYFDDYENGPHIEYADGKRSPVRTYFLWDTAGVDPSQGSSPNGFVIVGVDAENRWNILEAEEFKGKPSEVIARAVYLTAEYRPSMMKGEFVGALGHWRDLYVEGLKRAGVAIPGMQIVKSVPTRAKDTRIELGLEPLWRAGRIRLRVGLEVCAKQFDEFPKRTQKDVLDAMAQGADDPVLRPPSEREIEDRRPVDPDEDEYEINPNAGVLQASGSWVGTGTPVSARNQSRRGETGWLRGGFKR